MSDTDSEAVATLAIANGMFAEGDWQDPNLNELAEDHHWIVAVDASDEVVGAAYFAPEQVSDRLWNTYFLAVSLSRQGKGIGRTLMTYIENFAKSQNIRTLIVETSSLEKYSQARGFYLSLGYVKEAEIRDYYEAFQNSAP